MSRRVLITGAHGFLGSHAVEAFLEAGWRVRAMLSPWGDPWRLDAAVDAVRARRRGGAPAADRASDPEAQAHRVERVRADLTAPASLAGVFDDVDVVVHAAARVAEYGPWKPFYETNVQGTAHALRAGERAGVRRFVFVSSVAIFRYRGFRDADARDRVRDRHDLPYARSKILAEDLVRAAGLETVIARPGLWPFGPRDPTLDRVLGAASRGLMPIVGSGAAVINTAYAPALALGLVRCAEHPDAAGRSYVLAEPDAVSWNDLFDEVARLLGRRRAHIHLPAGAADAVARLVEPLWARLAPGAEPPITRYRAHLTVRDVHFSTENAERELGHVSPVGWRQALAESVASWRSR